MSADEVVIAIREQGGIVEALETDTFWIPTTIPLLFDRAEAAFGRVDILVNNADYGNADTFVPQSSARHGKSCSRRLCCLFHHCHKP